jgi:tetratricopeptide (TPR) repeat protein
MARNLRSLLVWFLAHWNDLKLKQIGAPSGLSAKRVSNLLGGETLSDFYFERFRAATTCHPGQVPIVEACHEALAALEQTNDLAPEVRAEIEMAVLKAARLLREGFTEALLLARPAPSVGYPAAPQRLPARRWAAFLWEQIKQLVEEKDFLDVIRYSERLQNWAICELLCEASVREASRDLKRAGILARVAQAVAELVRGPAGWLNRLKAYALAHWANVLRVQGDHKIAEAELEKAKRLWLEGSDPDEVLDRGRLLNLEGALRRAQRRFNEALACLDEAAAVSRSPELALTQKGFTLEVMGEYERAVETLLKAVALADSKGDLRLKSLATLNLAINYLHLERFGEAARLVAEARPVAAEDKINLVRIGWVEGRIAAGLGRRREALLALEQARRGFAAQKMMYDVALALLEECALLLDEGRHAEVKALTPALAQVFEAKEVHREALAALRLFQEAAEREKATAEMARCVLRYLFCARYDEELSFKAS